MWEYTNRLANVRYQKPMICRTLRHNFGTFNRRQNLFKPTTTMNFFFSSQPAAKAHTNHDWRQGSVKNSNGQFIMPWIGENDEVLKKPSLSAIISWISTRKTPVPPANPSEDFPVYRPDFSNNDDEVKCTWIGHATCLLQARGINILTDAVFSDRCSPVQWAGPLRFTPPACKIAELPKIDIVLTSHDHYDHLDWDSVMDLEKYHKPLYVCGLELGSWFTEAGASPERVIEMDWWQKINVLNEKVALEFVPVQHWSKRHLINDERRSLWGGFSVQIDGFKFFFNGDTGYSQELYEEIGSRCGPFDLAAIPIGAYEPRDFMKTQHIDPEEAYVIHRHLGCKLSFGIHYGTFILTDEPLTQPKERIEQLTSDNPNHAPFKAIPIGSSVVFDRSKNFRVDMQSLQ